MNDIETPEAPSDDSYAGALSRVLWFRQPDTRCRFLFAADDPEGLVIAPLGPKGNQTIVAAAKRLAAAGRKAISGAMLVDADGDPVFCVPADPAGFLRALSSWASRRVGEIPSLGTLQTAQAARLASALGGNETIEALDLASLSVLRDDAIWQNLLPPDDASVAAILADRLPGERMWFWMSNDVLRDMVPLLLQPVAWDPNRDRLDGQIRRLEALGAGDGVTGYALFAESGRLQFVGGALTASLMVELSDWVHEQVGTYPGLARLAHCQFVIATGGQVSDILEDEALWNDVVAPPAPGTLAEASALLTSLAPGASLWLWATGADGGFLSLSPVTGDEDGRRFQVRVDGFYRRFPDAHRDAVSGTVTRSTDGKFAVTVHGDDPGRTVDLLARVGAREKGLAALAKAPVTVEA